MERGEYEIIDPQTGVTNSVKMTAEEAVRCTIGLKRSAMEVMSLNYFLRDDITKLASSLIPHGFEGDVQTLRLVQDCLSTEINIIGEKSATDQGTTVVTSVEKLLNSDGFVLYLLKDAQANDGKGALIGILKVEKKKLFLTDEHAVVHKLEPLCVLDFYVVGEYQRKGLGKRLFSYMLKDLNTTTDQIAIDEPSTKLENFLNKNYGVKRLIRQNNNFAISPQFFENLEAIRQSAHIAPPVLRVGRFTARKPISDIGNIIHGSGSQNRQSAPIASSSSRVGRFTAQKPISEIANIIHGSGSQNRDSAPRSSEVDPNARRKPQ